MTIAIVLLVLAWVPCGVLARGMCRYNYAKMVHPSIKWAPPRELLNVLLIIGPLGLLVSFIKCTINRTWGVKFDYKE